MRDGLVVGETSPDAPQAELVRMLVGRAFSDLFPPRATTAGAEILRLHHARFDPDVPRAGWQAPRDVSLTVHEGEIVGLAGLMGVGRTELLSALHGFDVSGRWRGTVEVRGVPTVLGTVGAARRVGLAYVTDDRRGTGLVLHHTVAQNTLMSTLRRVTPFGLVSRTLERREVARAMEDYDVRAAPARCQGGEPFGREPAEGRLRQGVDERPEACCCSTRPTRGVDVGAKAEIYRRLRGLAESGLGVLVASSELPELIGLCDRIVVMKAGCTIHDFGPRSERRSDAPDLRRGGAGRMSTTVPTLSPVPPRPRRHPLAYLVRFQSLLGLVIVIMAGIAFSPRRHGHILFLEAR